MDAVSKACDIIKNIKLIDCIYMLKDAWTKVEPATINNCFGHAGFKLPGNVEAEQQVFETPENFTNDEWNDFVDFDNQLEIAGELNDEEITQADKACAPSCLKLDGNSDGILFI